MASGNIRAMFDFKGNQIEEAGPSSPALILGLNGVPKAGDLFQVCDSEREARTIVNERRAKVKESKSSRSLATLEDLFDRVKAGETAELRLILKADVQGSLEPIVDSLRDIDQSEVRINVLHAEAGNISENDILLASASQAIVMGFNVLPETSAKKLAEGEGISIRVYDIIYRLIEDVEKAVKGMLEPEKKEVVVGSAEVLQLFKITKVGTIAGCRVTKGEIRRNASLRVKRNDEVLFTGELASLKHEKENVREVKEGFECGLRVKGFNDFESGDLVESFVIEEVER
jgi:translation initiation factor IF-2